MDRLTYRSPKFNSPVSNGACKDITCSCECDSCKINDLIAKLCAYEDTGLEPEEIERIVDAYGRGHTLRTESAERLEIVREIKTGRLRELVQAEQDGKLVVLPCKVGDTVYVIDKGDYTHAFKPYVRPKPVREISWKATSRKDLGWGMILSGGDCGTSARYKLSSIGKTVFLTREEAEHA